MISVIIPAHNEETVIARCLTALTDGAAPGEIEVIVACNGCTDRTAEIARSFGGLVKVVEVDRASKIAALNAGDEAAQGFPRFYVDADVVLSLESVQKIAEALGRGEALLASPRLRMDLSRTSWPVRWFYEVWTSLPYNRVMVGTGVYALSKAGRERFGRFPEVIADDGFVRFSFAPEERTAVAGAEVWVAPPRTLAGLIRIKTRSRLGYYQLRGRVPRQPPGERKSLLGTAAHLAGRPSLIPKLPVYLLINLAVRLRAGRQLRRQLNAYHWEHDDSRVSGQRSAIGGQPESRLQAAPGGRGARAVTGVQRRGEMRKDEGQRERGAGD